MRPLDFGADARPCGLAHRLSSCRADSGLLISHRMGLHSWKYCEHVTSPVILTELQATGRNSHIAIMFKIQISLLAFTLLGTALLGLVQSGYRPRQEQVSMDNANSGMSIGTL